MEKLKLGKNGYEIVQESERRYKVKRLLKSYERTPAWLSRKMGVSSTMVYFWLQGKRYFSDEMFQDALSEIFNNNH
tara:strand:+ start:210 stop:437 length:228 start_codon:yes stop_codon:yes gene_type:complete